MRIQQQVLAIMGLWMLAGCASAPAPSPSHRLARGNACGALPDTQEQIATLYDSQNLRRVAPLRGEVGNAPASRASLASPKRALVGAELTILAQPGMDEAYVQRVLSCHAAGGGEAVHPNDPLRVEGVAAVDVDTRGSAYRVAIRAVSPEAGRAILDRARALRDASSTVDVQQIGQRPGARAAL